MREGAWLDVNSALDAELARCTAQPPEIGAELASMRVALRNAVVCTDFHATPRHDYTAILAQALTPGAGRDFAHVAAALREVHDHLPWVYHYAPQAGEPDLCERIAFAELVGPEGPMMAPAARVGLTLIAPHTIYPLHEHPAVELYWVISGTARWATRRHERIVPPGDFVLHRSREPHAMCTVDEPLLALWGWSGDIDAPALYC